MQTLKVNIPGGSYNINIQNGLLSGIDEQIKTVYRGEKIAVISDENVWNLYGEVFCKNCGFDVKKIIVKPGEGSKSIQTLETVYAALAKEKITRTDLIVAFGGGVVGDLAGFAASSFLRGVPFVQIPTTLLAQVDSSVGGKVAVNIKEGKNLAGAFYQPKLVITDPELLDTLDAQIFADGMAEVIKYGLIYDAGFFNRLPDTSIEDILYTCCDIKRKLVEKDEKDTGVRMLLNFGHTFGHAVEKHYNYSKYTHGQAVAAGMIMVAKIGEKLKVTPDGTYKIIEEALKKYGLPTSVELDEQAFAEAIDIDKKGEGKMINLILLEQIGSAVVYKIEKQRLTELYRAALC